MSDIADKLNYLCRPFSEWSFLGFAMTVKEFHFVGLKVGESSVVSLQVGLPPEGWGDSDPDPEYGKKFPWVLFAKGIDDDSYYRRFVNEHDARAFAKKILGKEIDFSKDKWLWQN